jgi:hypothetical protein
MTPATTSETESDDWRRSGRSMRDTALGTHLSSWTSHVLIAVGYFRP